MSKKQDINFAKNTLQMLVYEEALDLLIEKYVRDFVYNEDVPCLHTYYLEKNLKKDLLDKASEKISKMIVDVYNKKL